MEVLSMFALMIILFSLAGLGLLGLIGVMIVDMDNDTIGIACMGVIIVGLIGGCIPVIILDGRSDDACVAKGGRVVDDGPPIYVKSGNIMIPVQDTKCEMPR
jgi:hypothetical protein